jgi:predicted nuclease of predicted toxin-antitoxin system
MKFLLDQNLSPALVEMLATLGHDTRHVLRIGMHKSPDFDILIEADANNEIILTHDLDFGDLLAMSGKSTPSVIIFRISPINTNIFFELLRNNLPTLKEALEQGTLVIISSKNIRLRKLPIKPF